MKMKYLACTLFVAIVETGVAHAITPETLPAQTGTLDIRYQSTVNGLTTQLDLPLAGSANYLLGNYNFATRDTQTQASAGSFIGYCVDPFQWASSSFHTYEVKPLSSFLDVSSDRYADVTRLFGHAYADSLTNATKAAGFQLALWEVFNDDGNLAGGSVRTTTGTSMAIKGEAQSLLDLLNTWTDVGTSYKLTFHENSMYQNYLAVTGINSSNVPAIPEADSYAMLLAGLGLLGFMARRRLRH
jgi:hypothetical protein